MQNEHYSTNAERITKDWIEKNPEITLENSPIYEQIITQLKKKGLTYEEYLKLYEEE